MRVISDGVHLPSDGIELAAIRAQGAGGHNVNEVSCSVLLRFDSQVFSLSPFHKERLLALRDSRIAAGGAW